MDLKQIVFRKCKAEYDCYLEMESDHYAESDRAEQMARYMSVYQIIEESELEEEYQNWKKEMLGSEKD